MNIALLTAAGSGTRMHQDIPKQFIHVDNKPVIVYTMEAFQNHPSIDAIIVVTLESWSAVLWAYAKQFNITKLRWVVPGGETGQESIKNGLETIKKELPNEDVVVMVHDGNRPLVTSEVISDSLATYGKGFYLIQKRIWGKMIQERKYSRVRLWDGTIHREKRTRADL